MLGERERELLNDGRLTGVVCAGTGCILSFINQSGEEKQERVGREGKGSRLDRRDSSAHLKRHFLYSCYYCDVSDGMQVDCVG